MKTVLRLIVVVPIAVVLIAFAVANRRAVTVSFDPFASDVSAFDLSGPLFFVLIVTLVVGLLVGGAATWITQGRHRRARRAAEVDADTLRAENARLHAELGRAAATSGLPAPLSSGPMRPGRAA